MPVIGCGAGTVCHGQVVVMQDLAGMTKLQPSFAQPISSIGDEIANVASSWMRNVSTNNLGKHPYSMREGESELFKERG